MFELKNKINMLWWVHELITCPQGLKLSMFDLLTMSKDAFKVGTTYVGSRPFDMMSPLDSYPHRYQCVEGDTEFPNVASHFEENIKLLKELTRDIFWSNQSAGEQLLRRLPRGLCSGKEYQTQWTMNRFRVFLVFL